MTRATWSESPFGWPAAPTSAVRPVVPHVRLVALTILLLPLNWYLGTTLVWLYLAAGLLLLAPLRLSAVEIAFGILLATLAFGLVVAVAGGAAADRIVAAIFNLSVIVVLIAFITAGRRLQGDDPAAVAARRRIYGAAFICFLAFIAAVILVQVDIGRNGLRTIRYDTLLLSRLGELPGILEAYSQATLAIVDWRHGEAAMRITGFGVYATEGAILFLLLGLMAAVGAAFRGWRAGLALFEVAIIAVLLMMASRTTLFAYAVSLLLLPALFWHRLKIAIVLFAPLIVVVLGLLAYYAMEFAYNLVQVTLDARGGSSSARFENYRLAVQTVVDDNILTGLGIKPREGMPSGIPLGSHSSFVSMFVKGGVLGLAAFLVVWLMLLARLARDQMNLLFGGFTHAPWQWIETVYLSRAVLALLVWWITEDFDAPIQQAALAGLVIGLMWSARPSGRRRPDVARVGWH